LRAKTKGKIKGADHNEIGWGNKKTKGAKGRRRAPLNEKGDGEDLKNGGKYWKTHTGVDKIRATQVQGCREGKKRKEWKKTSCSSLTLSGMGGDESWREGTGL